MTSLVLVLALLVAAIAIEMIYSAHRRASRMNRVRCIEQIASLLMSHDEPNDDDIHQLRTRFSDREILDAVIFVASRICGARLYRLSLVVEVCESDYHLLHTLRYVWRQHRSSLPLYLVLLPSLLTLLAGVWGSLRLVIVVSLLSLILQFVLLVARRTRSERSPVADLGTTLKTLPLFLHAHAHRRRGDNNFE